MQKARSMKTAFRYLSVAILLQGTVLCQEAGKSSDNLRVKWEELTSPDFALAIAKSSGTCVIPLGILEKHGPHLPLGTDLLDIREVVLRAAQKEYTIVFPPYYFGQIFEAKHQPGTVAYSQKLIWDILQETCDELARNGIKKIVLASGHGGNSNFLPYFCQAQLANRKDYVVYLFQPPRDADFDAQVRKLRKTTAEAHAGEVETSTVIAHRPDLVKLSNIQIFYKGGGTKDQAALEPAERENDYPEPNMFGDLPAYGFFIRHVKGIELSGIAISYLKEDLRPAFVLDDIRGIDFDRLKAQHAADVPTFLLKKVEDFSLHQCKGLADTRLDRVDLKKF